MVPLIAGTSSRHTVEVDVDQESERAGRHGQDRRHRRGMPAQRTVGKGRARGERLLIGRRSAP